MFKSPKINYSNVNFLDYECDRKEATQMVEAFLEALKAGVGYDIKFTHIPWTNIVTMQIAYDRDGDNNECELNKEPLRGRILYDAMMEALSRTNKKMSREERRQRWATTDEFNFPSPEFVGPDCLLYINPPKKERLDEPINDLITSFMKEEFSNSEECASFLGFHTTDCGEHSDSHDYLLSNGLKTSSLCVFYLSYYRNSIPKEEWKKLMALAEYENREAVVVKIKKYYLKEGE